MNTYGIVTEQLRWLRKKKNFWSVDLTENRPYIYMGYFMGSEQLKILNPLKLS